MSTISRRTAVRLLGLALVGASTFAIPAPAAAGPLDWRLSKTPAVSGANRLIALAASGRSQVWAVGGHTVADGTERSLVHRWNGRAWAVVPSPAGAPLNAVSSLSGNDAWAVGSSADGSRSVIQRWNGNAWTLVDHVAASPGNPVSLGGVVALASDDAVAVGYRGDLLAATPHAQHWDGRQWREKSVPVPPGAVATVLAAVTTANGLVWASGFSIMSDFQFRPWLVRWDGRSWVSVGDFQSLNGAFSDLAVVGPNNLLAVGSELSADGVPAPMIVSLTGSTWTREMVPVNGGELDGVSLDSRGNVLVVGHRVGPGGHDDRAPLVLSRQPLGWTVEPLPATGPAGLRDVLCVAGTSTAWAVGATGVTDETHRGLTLSRGIGRPTG